MILIKSLVISFVVISILNVIINKDSKHLKKNIGVMHYILGYFFIVYLEIGQLFMHRATDINDLIMNTIGAVVGWVIFNAIRKGSCKFSAKTAINISSNDTLAIKLESCVYVVVAVMCLF
ncbi:VanZ family protein [Clostridium sp.]|jgi:glycopeptide antibiotics resistance protein|uniref:VanZ family protein n=1 Tax=Clostridium sp. TaxID=1506 RepID=UPI002FDE611E